MFLGVSNYSSHVQIYILSHLNQTSIAILLEIVWGPLYIIDLKHNLYYNNISRREHKYELFVEQNGSTDTKRPEEVINVLSQLIMDKKG